MLTPARTPRCGGRPRTARRDAGVGLVELSVAMVVTAVVLAVAGSGLVLVVGAYRTVQDESSSHDRGRVLVDRLDRDLRQAIALNFPRLDDDRWYVEYRTDERAPAQPSTAPPTTAPPTTASTVVATCTQWRLDVGGRTLATRSWPADAAAAPPWSVVASGITLDGGQPPFVLTPAGPAAAHQQLTVRFRLTLDRGSAATTATLTARNSSPATASNADTDGDGASDAPVCTIGAQP